MRFAFAALLALAVTASSSCTEPDAVDRGARPSPTAVGAEDEPRAVRFERAGDDWIVDERRAGDGAAWDLIATDMDADGDPDLLVNRRSRGGLRLYRNEQGRFSPVEPADGRLESLPAHPSIWSLTADAGDIVPRVRASRREGLYLWQDSARPRRWHFFWKEDLGRFGGLRLSLRTGTSFSEVGGIDAAEIERPAPDHVQVRLSAARGERAFHLSTKRWGSQLEVELEGAAGRPAPPLYIGRSAVRWLDERVEVWSPDPRAMAWVNVEGGKHPELFVARGALAGLLQPPLRPKSDLYYVATGSAPEPYVLSGSDVVPADYGDGYRAEWVDTDVDGTLELSVANRGGPNALLARLPLARGFRDRASELGLDLDDSHVETWADYDGDGLDDLYIVAADQIRILRNAGSVGFEPLDGRGLGLVLPATRLTAERNAHTGLRIVDFDADGALDLLLVGRGPMRNSYLFRRSGDRFRDVSQEVGIRSVGSQAALVVFDADDDGFDDAVSLGRRVNLWHNQRGERFDIRVLAGDVIDERVRAACALDVDGDGDADIVAAGKRLHLLRNVSDSKDRVVLQVALDPGRPAPIGAVVRAYYEDGHVLARRLGSADVTTFSQAAGPLRFPSRPARRVVRVGVRWPGHRAESVHDVRGSETKLEVAR